MFKTGHILSADEAQLINRVLVHAARLILEVDAHLESNSDEVMAEAADSLRESVSLLDVTAKGAKLASCKGCGGKCNCGKSSRSQTECAHEHS